jgi:hypothetical protein
VPVSGLTFRYEGQAAVDRNLRRTGVKVSDLDFKAIAAEGMRLAASFAPERTGKLKRSLRASKSKNKATIRAGGAKAIYAGPINYGWKRRNIPASRFMQRADEVLQRTVPAELERQIKALTDRWWLR